ncbi:MAG: DUF1592 domain-containing protein [Myxococcota bacterium]
MTDVRGEEAPGGGARPDEETLSAGVPGVMFPERAFSDAPGVRRLTRAEYRRVVADLTGVDASGLDVPAEFVAEHHSQIAGAQRVGNADTERFVTLGQRVAEERVGVLLAEQGCEVEDGACVRAWAEGMLELAWRGPVAQEDAEVFLALLEDERAGATGLERAQTFLAAALSTPRFLYRTEIGDGGGSADVALTPYEVAARLSFLVWQSTPDRALLEAAARGEMSTSEGRLGQLARMLEDPRAVHGTRAFVADWMGVFGDAIATKDASVLEGTDPELAREARASFDATVDDVLDLGGQARYVDVLDTRRFQVTAQIGALVGAEGPTQGLGPVDLGAERAGLLTHPLVLAAHTKESGASPFPIGAFVYGNVLCETIPVIEEIPEDTSGVDETGLTLRQKLEARTAAPECAACHTRIGPTGFAFLPFDPIGRWYAEDAQGRPYDTTGEIPVFGDTIAFADVTELTSQLAAHPAAARCVADRLFRWTYGRFEGPGDEEELGALRVLASDEEVAARELLEAIVASEAFTAARHGGDR